MPLVLRLVPREELKPYNVVLGRWPAQPAKFRRAPAEGSAGNGCGVVQGFPRLDFDPWLRRGGAGGVVRRRRPLPAVVRSALARWRLGGKRERVDGL
jgi:hypothetical protein